MAGDGKVDAALAVVVGLAESCPVRSQGKARFLQKPTLLAQTENRHGKTAVAAAWVVQQFGLDVDAG
ncbi:MAG: hypothetical protein NT154_01375 [Verrucomicrobia bacterium]|nr:hypothetical protein [Verrucomicrobiota bacterium]